MLSRTRRPAVAGKNERRHNFADTYQHQQNDKEQVVGARVGSCAHAWRFIVQQTGSVSLQGCQVIKNTGRPFLKPMNNKEDFVVAYYFLW